MSSVAAMTSGNDWGVNDQNVDINATNIADLLEAKVLWLFLHKYKHRVALFQLIIYYWVTTKEYYLEELC